MNLPISQQIVPELADSWIERIFQRMENFYLAKWLDQFVDIPRARVKKAWAQELVDYDSNEIKRGLESCRTRPWPPTLPEFLVLCRPVVDGRTEWAEACEQMRVRLQGKGEDKWSRPEVYWAAISIGSFDLNQFGWEQIRSRWQVAIESSKTDQIPEYHAPLPPPGKQSISREESSKRVAEIGVKIKSADSENGNKGWAYKLAEREVSGYDIPHTSRLFWREALGIDKKMPASEALEILRGEPA